MWCVWLFDSNYSLMMTSFYDVMLNDYLFMYIHRLCIGLVWHGLVWHCTSRQPFRSPDEGIYIQLRYEMRYVGDLVCFHLAFFYAFTFTFLIQPQEERKKVGAN